MSFRFAVNGWTSRNEGTGSQPPLWRLNTSPRWRPVAAYLSGKPGSRWGQIVISVGQALSGNWSLVSNATQAQSTAKERYLGDKRDSFCNVGGLDHLVVVGEGCRHVRANEAGVDHTHLPRQQPRQQLTCKGRTLTPFSRTSSTLKRPRVKPATPCFVAQSACALVSVDAA